MGAWQSKLVNAGIAALAVAVSVLIAQPPKVDPQPAPVPVVESEPEAVYVFDATGKRASPELESAAGKFVVGTWRVVAVPKVGEVGWERTIVVTGGPVVPVPPGPAPPTPTPVPPEPTPPPVVSGKRELLIVRETADVTTPLSGLLVALRNGPSFDYLKTKGHKLAILDDDSVNEAGQPSKLVEAWRPHFAGMTLPVLFIIDAQSRQLLHKESIAPTATADNIIERVREHGG